MSGERDYHRPLVRGALANFLGLTAKLINPLYFVLITWLFGPELIGLYFLAVFITEIAVNAAVSGIADAVTILASHHADGDRDRAPDPAAQDRLYQLLGNGVAMGLGVSALLVPLFYVGGHWLVLYAYPDRPELPGALQILAWSIPLTALPRIAIAATKARMVMRHDAFIMGLVRPLALVCLTLLAWWAGGGLAGLLWAQVAAQALVSALALRALARHFDMGRILGAAVHPRLDGQLLRFAVPQSLNMTANRYLSRIDVFMLAALGHGNFEIALYATAALITSNLREIKLAFAQALAPVAARLHIAGDRAAFEETLGRVSRWTASLAAPLVLAVLVLRGDLLGLVDAGYRGDTTFMAVLLIPPFLSCAFGLAGNSIIYTAHPTWTLFNSLAVAAVNTGLNLLLIPAYGLLGAATATALAAAMISLLQLVELRHLEGIRLPLRSIWKPHLALLLTGLVVAALWDPAGLRHLTARLGLAVGLVLFYGAALLLLRHEELTGLGRRLAPWRPGRAG